MKPLRLYVQRARKSIVYGAAARAWSYGVPWAEALKYAEEAVATGSGDPKPIKRRR